MTEPGTTCPLWAIHFNNPYGPDQAAMLPLLRRLVGVFEEIERDFDAVYLRALLITQDLIDEHGRGTLPSVAIYFEGIKRHADYGWPWEAVTLEDLKADDGEDFITVADALARAAGVFRGRRTPNGTAAGATVVLTQSESMVDGLVVRTDVFRSL